MDRRDASEAQIYAESTARISAVGAVALQPGIAYGQEPPSRELPKRVRRTVLKATKLSRAAAIVFLSCCAGSSARPCLH